MSTRTASRPGRPTAETPIGAKADGGELRVRAAEMTLWVDVVAEVSRDGDLAVVTVLGRTSRTLGDLCELMGRRPLALGEVQLQWAYGRGVDAFVDGCPSGGTWCRLDGLTTWMAPECLDAPADLAAVVEHIGTLDQALGTGRFPEGQVLDRDGLAATPIFSATYSPGGPQLFAEIDALMESGPVEGWWLSEEVPCHNCTDFQDTIVLWFPEALRVVYLRAGHGFDS